MTDLRTLAQAVVTLRCEIDALALEANGLTGDAYKAATKRWWEMVRRLQKMNDDLRGDGLGERILAALNAERAQGYARAMGEVVTLCTTRTPGTKPRNEHSDYTLGWLDATDAVASWARERLPAAAERD